VEAVGHEQPLASTSGTAFGSRPQTSSNTFACGARQNYGSVQSDTPTRRARTPPGGASSFSLGWDCGQSERLPNEFEASRLRSLKAHAEPLPAGRPTAGRSSSVTNSSVMSARGVNISDDAHVTPRRRAKEEVDGSRPKVWKPSIALRAPPGGNGSFSPDWASEVSVRSTGRRLVPEAAGGSSNDVNAIEALRFFRKEDRLGKQQTSEVSPLVEKGARDSHRYFLAADARAATSTMGKAQCRVPGQRESLSAIFEPTPRSARPRCGPPSWAGAASQSTYADSAEAALQQRQQQQPGCEPQRQDGAYSAVGCGSSAAEDFDSLPLGAEWSTWELSDSGMQPQPQVAWRGAERRV